MLLPIIKALGFELIGLKCIHSHSLILRFYIDHISGININDCVNVSQKLSTILDLKKIITVPYTLEVSSPGINRPIFTVEHYIRFIKKEIVLVLRTEKQHCRKWKGVIKSVKGNTVIITVNKKDEVFKIKNIQKANLISKF